MKPEYKEWIEKQAAGYAAIEMAPECEPTGEERARYIAALNKSRAERGFAPVANDEDFDPSIARRREAANARFARERAADRPTRRAAVARRASDGRSDDLTASA